MEEVIQVGKYTIVGKIAENITTDDIEEGLNLLEEAISEEIISKRKEVYKWKRY